MKGRHLFFASCAEDGGIYHYKFDKGELIFAEKTPCKRPMYMDVTEDSMEVVLQKPFPENELSGLVKYVISDGRLTDPSEIICTEGVEGCHNCRFSENSYVANYTSGSLFSTSGKTVVHEGHGPNPDRQEAPHIHFVKPSPDGKYLLCVDLGLDTIFTYDAELNVISKAKVPDGYGPRHLAYSDDGRTVFCVNELDSSISVFDYADGGLTYRESVKLLRKQVQNNTAAAIRVCGSWVYASDRGDDSISALYWDGEQLTLRSVTKCGGKSPRDFLIVDGYLFCANEGTDNVTVFTVEGDRLTKLKTELKMSAPLCVNVL